MKLLILSQEKKIFEGNASSLSVPGEKGTIEILPGHADAFFLLKQGNVKVSGQKEIEVTHGLCKVIRGEAVVLI